MKKREKSIKKDKTVLFIFARYIVLLLLVLSLPLIYLVLTPLTVYPVFYLLKIFVETTLVFNQESLNYFLILGGKTSIEIVSSCISGSAYLLLLILNLSVAMKRDKRILSLVLSLLIFFVLNLFRIIIFSLFYYYDFSFVDLTHKIFWYFGSTFFVVGIWFLNVKIFKIKEIPFYSDIKFILLGIYKKSKN